MRTRIARILRAAADRLDPPRVITGARVQSLSFDEDMRGLSFQFDATVADPADPETLRAFLARALRAYRERS